jgi:hypothetical protein
MMMAFLRGLERAPTFLVPIINPPFADTARNHPPGGHRAGSIPMAEEGKRPTAAKDFVARVARRWKTAIDYLSMGAPSA